MIGKVYAHVFCSCRFLRRAVSSHLVLHPRVAREREHNGNYSCRVFTYRAWDEELFFNSEVVRVKGTTVLACPIDAGNYGHNLLDTAVPSFWTLHSFPRLAVKPWNVLFQHQDDRWGPFGKCSALCRSVMSLIVPPERVWTSDDVYFNKDQLFCFQNLAVGAQERGVIDSADMSPGDYGPFRDHVTALHRLNAQSTAKTGCDFVLLQRANRKVVNVDSLVEIVQKLTTCRFRMVMFENTPPLFQVKTVLEADIYAGVSGTGMHNAIFMRDRTAFIDIVHPFHHWSNDHVCKIMASTHSCQTVLLNSVVYPSDTPTNLTRDDAHRLGVFHVLNRQPIFVNVTEFSRKLSTAFQFVTSLGST